MKVCMIRLQTIKLSEAPNKHFYLKILALLFH